MQPSRARRPAQTARVQAEAERPARRRAGHLALPTVQSLITQTNDKLQGPGLYEVRQGLLDVALQNVNRVADVYDKAPSSKEATTRVAMIDSARIYRLLGQSDKASGQFLKGLEIAKERIKIKKGTTRRGATSHSCTRTSAARPRS